MKKAAAVDAVASDVGGMVLCHGRFLSRKGLVKRERRLFAEVAG
jgi:hypothetical protein